MVAKGPPIVNPGGRYQNCGLGILNKLKKRVAFFLPLSGFLFFFFARTVRNDKSAILHFLVERLEVPL